MIEARGVSVRLGGRPILAGIDLDLAPGELLAIIGPNGAGKSTLLRMLTGEADPSAGTVRVARRRVRSWPRRELARRLAVLPQESSLGFAFPCIEVVLMGRMPHGGGRGAGDLAIAEEAMARADVLHLAERSYPTLSGGERQRVHLARVLAQVWEAGADGLRYLLLDEPTSSLDLAHQHAALRLARRLSDEGAGVLAVLHDPNLAAQYADRIAVLHQGAIRADGRPEEVLRPDLLTEVFEIAVMVTPHPVTGRPLVLTLPD